MKKKTLLFIMLMVLLAPWAAKAYNYQVQVGSGSSSSYNAPINLFYNYSYTQQIYTASQINGDCSLPGEIESISFYYAGTVEKTAPITVFMKTTDKTSFSNASDWETVTVEDIVFDDDWTVSPSGWITITFTTPFIYDGQSNLVIAINKGYYSDYSGSTKFRYTATTNYQLLYKQNDDNAYDPYAPPTGSRSKNLPNIIFNMTLPYPAPTGLAYENINPNTTTVTWTAPVSSNTVTSYSYQYKKTTETDWSNAEMVNNTSVTLNTLEGITSYNFKVCAIYGNQESCFADINFTTIDPCSAPTEFVANPANITHESAVISWTPGYDETAWLVKYKKSSDEWTNASEENVNAPNVILNGLESNTIYDVRISPDCDNDKYLSGSFITKNPCAAPTELVITNILTDEATLSWTPGYMETEWTVKYKKSTVTSWDDAETETVTSPTITLTNLEDNTLYNVQVYNCLDATPLSYNFYTAEACPDGFVCIGSGHSTHSYFPTYTTYNYSLTQQIYTAAEIGGTGAIMSLSFYSTATERTRTLDIYMMNTEKTSFASATDYIAVAATDLVYSGSVTFAQNTWTSITLDYPFQYSDDTQNVAIIVHDKTNSYVTSPSFEVFTASNQALYTYNDYYGYDPSTPGTYVPGSSTTTYNFSLASVKNKIRLGMGELSDCDMPTNLTVSNITMQTANLTWTAGGSETAWQICVNGDETNLIDVTSNSYQLTGLTGATTYTVKVRANCGSSQSYWTPEVSFSTEICDEADQCQISYEFSVSNYTSWHNATIDVVDVETNIVIATVGYDIAPTGTVTVCNGRSIKFVYNPATPAYYNGYNVYAFTDVNGEEIFSGTGNGNSTEVTTLYTYTVDCTVTSCRKPTNFAASEIDIHSAKLSWTENGEATAWVVAYKADGESEFTDVNADANPFTLTGLDPETEYTVKVKPVCEVDKWSIEITFTTDVGCQYPTIGAITTTPFTATVNWTGFSDSYNLRYVANTNYDSFFQGFVTDPGAMSNGADASWLHGSATFGPGVQHTSGNILADDFTVYVATQLTKIEVYSYQTNSPTTSTFTGLYVEIYDGNPMSGGNVIWGDMTTNIMTSTSFTNCYRGEDNNVDVMTRPIMAITASNLDINLTPGTYWLAYSLEGSGSSGPWGVPYCDPINGNIGNGIQYLGSSSIWQNLNSNGAYGLAMKLTFGDGNIESWDWTNVNDITENTYTITNLDHNTFHLVQVRGNCGSDGLSQWSDLASFTTPSSIPFDLEADVLDVSTTLSWDGYMDAYNVRYRTASHRTEYYFNDFNDQNTDGWEYSALPSATGDPSNHFLGLCYASTGEETLIFCELPTYESGSVVEFYYFGFSTANTFQVGYSSTDNTLESFNWGNPINVPAGGGNPSVSVLFHETLPTGTKYVALKATATSTSEAIFIDDFGIFGPTIPAGDWTTLNDQNSPLEITTLPGTAYEWQVQGVCASCGGGVTDWSEMASFTTYKKVYDNENWVNGETTIGDDVLLIQDVIIPDGVVAYANSITLEPGAHLIIEDGGQLYTNEPVVATVQKELLNTSKSADNWYTISSPVNDIAPASVTNLIQGSTDDYDLYLYDEPTTMWLNQKNAANAAIFANLMNGRGYLYWNSTGADLAFTGTLNVYALGYAFDKTGDGDLAGFNLIGNPFSHNIYKGAGGAIDCEYFAEGFYVLDNSGAWGSKLDYTEPIKPCQGILVQATTSSVFEFTNSITPATGEKRSNDDNIMFVVNNSQFEDAAYALFKDAIGLSKINHRNADAPMIYIPQDGENYAIATMGDDTETFGLNFKAMTTGMYTLSVKADGMFSYLHVIDRLTGEDIDMLVDGKYEFIGSPRDNEARFIVKLRYNANGFNNDEFIYQNGDELIVNGEGELQVYDVMGRYVACYNVNGNKRISAEQFSNAVYIFRLVGSDVKTQKIVVR